MNNVLSDSASIAVISTTITALTAIGLSIYWLFNKKARQRDLLILRNKLDELKPTDPEYNQVRALYISMMLDAERTDFLDSSDHAGVSEHHDMGTYHSDPSHFTGD
jgi:hypothetical protein